MKEGMQVMASGTVSRWFSPEFTKSNPEAIEKVRRMVASTPIDRFVASIRALQNFDLNPYLKGIVAPALLVVGELDAALVPTMKTMADEIPHAKYFVIPNAGYVPMVDGLAILEEILKDFLNY
jgi:3-oxoadipate enol-lactonase